MAHLFEAPTFRDIGRCLGEEIFHPQAAVVCYGDKTEDPLTAIAAPNGAGVVSEIL